MAPQASIYTPIIDPPRPLPSYLNIDTGSEWYTSSLIISAVETITLPARLRGYHDVEAALAGNGGVYKVFELQSSVIPDKESRSEQSFGLENLGLNKKVKEEDELETEFDLNFTYNDRTGETHIFNQVEVVRGLEPEKKEEPLFAEDPGLARKRRLFESGSIYERFVFTYLLVHLTDTGSAHGAKSAPSIHQGTMWGVTVTVSSSSYGINANCLCFSSF